MICLAVQLSAATNAFPWTPDKDYFLVAAQSTNISNASFVSTDPAITTTLLNTPTSKFVSYDVLVFLPGTSGKAGISGIKIPVQKDRTLFFTSGSALTIFLYLDEVISAE